MQIQLALAESQYDRVVSLASSSELSSRQPAEGQVDQCLGRGYLKQKQYAQAIEVLKPLIATAGVATPAEAGDGAGARFRTPRWTDAALQTNQYYLGLAYLGDRQFEAALEALAKVQVSPENKELYGGVRWHTRWLWRD